MIVINHGIVDIISIFLASNGIVVFGVSSVDPRLLCVEHVSWMLAGHDPSTRYTGGLATRQLTDYVVSQLSYECE